MAIVQWAHDMGHAVCVDMIVSDASSPYATGNNSECRSGKSACPSDVIACQLVYIFACVSVAYFLHVQALIFPLNFHFRMCEIFHAFFLHSNFLCFSVCSTLHVAQDLEHFVLNDCAEQKTYL